MSARGETLMELHFCSVCGVSIPNVEVESGEARAEDGDLVCPEHRSAAGSAASDAEASEEDLELLFCANCRVSVPQTDYRSGRARREYGSLLCGVCAKADPGTRAARREAVEAEMAADVEANDPVQTRRCNVCSAAVPQSHIVTGKALVSGDSVTCEACRAVASGAGAGGGFVRTFAMVVFVAAVAGAVGYVIGPMVLQKDQPDPLVPLNARIAGLEQEITDLDRRPADPGAAERGELAGELARMRTLLDEDLRSEITAVRSELAGVRGELAREDARTEQRLARLEGQIDQIMKSLAARANEPPREVVRDDPPEQPERPVREKPPVVEEGPVMPDVNPEVVRLAKDLLESPEDGVRFPAANELGRIGDEAAIPALAHALVNDKHFLVRRACARSLNMLKAWYATPALVDALEDKEAYVAQQANFALRSITGEDFQVTQDQSLSERKRRAKKARKWWDQNKDSPPEGVSLQSAELVQ
jgi:hypothetical protein